MNFLLNVQDFFSPAIDFILTSAVIIAPITAIIMLLPQVPETWRIRHDSEKLKGISVGTQILMGVNSIMWLLMGVQMNSLSVAAASIVTLPVIMFTLYLVSRSLRKEKKFIHSEPGMVEPPTFKAVRVESLNLR